MVPGHQTYDNVVHTADGPARLATEPDDKEESYRHHDYHLVEEHSQDDAQSPTLSAASSLDAQEHSVTVAALIRHQLQASVCVFVSMCACACASVGVYVCVVAMIRIRDEKCVVAVPNPLVWCS